MATERERSILIGLVVASVLLLILAFIGNVNAKKQARLAQDEMALRMDLERQVDILSRENDSLKRESTTVREQLAKERAASEALKGALVEEQKTSGTLKDELEKMTRLKETLEEDLKEALTTKPSEVPGEEVAK